MKCVITGQVTKNKANGIPLSRDGRGLLNKIVTNYNEKLKNTYLDAVKERGENKLPQEVVESMAPSVNKSKILRELAKDPVYKDLEEIRNEVLQQESESNTQE